MFLSLQVLSYFTTKLDGLDKNMSPSEVLEVITQGALQFKRDRLKVSTQITNTVGGVLTKAGWPRHRENREFGC